MNGSDDRWGTDQTCHCDRFGVRCSHDSYGDSKRPQGYLKIDDERGVVEVPLRQFVSLLLRIDNLVSRMDEMLDTREGQEEDDSGYVSRAEFLAFTREWLESGDRKCGIVRLNGVWTHVSRDGSMVGAWKDIEEAMTETSCENDCDEEAFIRD